MSQFLESICFDGTNYPLIDYHQKRVDRVFKEIYQSDHALQLKEIIPQMIPDNLTYKVRVTYEEKRYDIETIPYIKKSIRSLQVIQSDSISYDHKYANRSEIEQLFAQRNGADDILILKKGFMTDASYANLAFLKDQTWYTPRSPLLRGVRREHLLSQGMIIPEDIQLKDIQQYEQIALFNAMIDLGDLLINTDQIRL